MFVDNSNRLKKYAFLCFVAVFFVLSLTACSDTGENLDSGIHLVTDLNSQIDITFYVDGQIETAKDSEIATGDSTCDYQAPPPPADSTCDQQIPVGSCGNTQETEVFNLTNQFRSNNGLNALNCDPIVGQVARAYSQYMCTAGFFSHIGPDGSNPSTRLKAAGLSFYAAGENIAAGQSSAQDVMNSWMNSSGHRANILNSNFTHLGVGYVSCPSGQYPHYWTQNFLGK